MNDIPVVILCGGPGTRMGDTRTKKELVDIDGRPLLWHVMRIFATYNHRRFVLALGFLSEQVRRYFAEHDHPSWDITLVDTGTLLGSGSQVEKGTRIARVADCLSSSRFFVAYGEAVADINLDELVAFHEQHGKLATVTGVRARCQYGVFDTGANDHVSGFVEKPQLPYWINGGFMLFEQPVMDLVQGNNVDLERHVLSQLARQNELMLYRHSGYWQSMKTLKDAMALRAAWNEHKAWKIWED